MNYLILTPDGVGSTLLQRALTVYLNSAGLDYYNTHELLNGLCLAENRALIKDFSVGYSQSLGEIQNLLNKNSANLVSRLADYHVYNRSNRKKENYIDFYKFCNQYYSKIIYCVRDPFEYALSWAIRNQTKTLNVYSIGQRVDVHSVGQTYSVDIEYFKSKLSQYIEYQYWAQDNFSNLMSVEYNDLNYNIDAVLEKISGKSTVIEKNFKISLNQYSKALYYCSLQTQKATKLDISKFIKSNLKNIIALTQYQQKLTVEKKLISPMPIKMNTLQEKKQRILNFNETVDVYNSWTASSNLYKQINQDDITGRILKEQDWYDIK